MNSRSPSAALAAPISASSSSSGRVDVALGERWSGAAACRCGPPLRGAPIDGRWGQPGRPATGLSASELICRRIPGRRRSQLYARRGPRHVIDSRTGARVRCRHDGARGAATARRHDPRRPRLLPVQGRRRPGHLRRQGQVAPVSGCRTTSATPRSCRRAPPDGGDGRDRRVDPGPQRGRGAHARVQPHQAAPAPVQRPAAGRQELPVPRRHPERRVAPGRWSCGASERKGIRYFGPYGHAYAIRETLDLLLRTFPIRTCSRQQVRPPRSGSGRPCLLFHIEKCAGPCVGEIDEGATYDAARRRAHRLPRRRHRPGRQAARAADAGGGRRRSSSSGRPGCATG